MATYTFIVGEGKVRLVDRDSAGAGRECTALLGALFVAAPANALIALTILRSHLRSHIFNLFLATIAAADFLDAILNFSVAVLFRGSWMALYGAMGNGLMGLCHVNAAFTQMPMLLQVSCLVQLASHRLSGLSFSNKSPVKPSKKKRWGWLLVLAWVTSFTSVLPILFGAVDVRLFQERYSCSIVNATKSTASLATSVSLMALGHLLQYVILVIVWTLLLLRVHRERQRLLTLELVAMQRAAARSSPVRGLGSSSGFSFSTRTQFWGNGDTSTGQDGRSFSLICVLTALQNLMVLPGLLYQFTTQFSLPSQWSHHHHHLEAANSTSLPQEFIPLHSPWFDGTFTWLRILHSFAVPTAILIFHQPIRSQSAEILGLCRPTQRPAFPTIPSISGIITGKRKRSKFRQLFDENTPVLYVTDDGLYVRQSVEISQMSKTILTSIFADLCLGKMEPSDIFSPRTSMMQSDVRIVEEAELHGTKTRKMGKSVRFSQKVSEIPEAEFGVENVSMRWKREDGPDVFLGGKVMDGRDRLERRQVQDFITSAKRRVSEPVIMNRAKERTLEMELANNSFGSSSSTSLLLQLSQRMRPREN